VASAHGGIQTASRRTNEKCENIGALARELKLERKLLYTCKYQFEGRTGRRGNIPQSTDRDTIPSLGSFSSAKFPKSATTANFCRNALIY